MDEEERELREAIRRNPNDAEAHYNLAIFLENLHRYEKGEKEYKEVIRINPNFAAAYYNLARLYSIKKRLKGS